MPGTTLESRYLCARDRRAALSTKIWFHNVNSWGYKEGNRDSAGDTTSITNSVVYLQVPGGTHSHNMPVGSGTTIHVTAVGEGAPSYTQDSSAGS